MRGQQTTAVASTTLAGDLMINYIQYLHASNAADWFWGRSCCMMKHRISHDSEGCFIGRCATRSGHKRLYVQKRDNGFGKSPSKRRCVTPRPRFVPANANGTRPLNRAAMRRNAVAHRWQRAACLVENGKSLDEGLLPERTDSLRFNGVPLPPPPPLAPLKCPLF